MWSVISRMSEELREIADQNCSSDHDEDQMKETNPFSLPPIPEGNEIPENLGSTTPPPMTEIS